MQGLGVHTIVAHTNVNFQYGAHHAYWSFPLNSQLCLIHLLLALSHLQAQAAHAVAAIASIRATISWFCYELTIFPIFWEIYSLIQSLELQLRSRGQYVVYTNQSLPNSSTHFTVRKGMQIAVSPTATYWTRIHSRQPHIYASPIL